MIRTYARREGERFCLYVTGHAGEGEQGARVCAAVSVLVGMLVGYARTRPDCCHVRAMMVGGNCSLSCTGGIGEVFELIIATLSRLAAENPSHMEKVEYMCS